MIIKLRLYKLMSRIFRLNSKKKLSNFRWHPLLGALTNVL